MLFYNSNIFSRLSSGTCVFNTSLILHTCSQLLTCLAIIQPCIYTSLISLFLCQIYPLIIRVFVCLSINSVYWFLDFYPLPVWICLFVRIDLLSMTTWLCP